MSAFDIYILALCILIIVLLTSVSIAVVVIIYKLSCKLIRTGAEDDNILAEVNKTQSKSEKIGKVIDQIVSLIFAVVFIVAFALSTMVACTKNVSLGSVPVFRVVNSDSMSKKHEKNKYLTENNLNDQFDTFDLIITYDVPKEEDLKLYDVVVYKYKDVLIVHRIVDIVTVGNETHYVLKGDAEEYADSLPVDYSQMVAIYRGEHIPFIGSFIKFMQSPAGYICIVLVLVAMIAGPLCDKRLQKERLKRLAILQGLQSANDSVEPVSYNGEEKLETSNSNVAIEGVALQGNGEEELQPTKQERAIEESENNFVIEQETIENELAITEEIEEKGETINPFASVNGVALPFIEKLKKAPKDTKNRYQKIVEFLARIDGVRVINGKKFETYKYKNVAILRFAIRGKTLNAYLGLNASEYENSKYVFENVSNKGAFKNYQMRVKITSERQARWTLELLNDIVNKNGLKLNEVLKLEEVKLEQVENDITGEIEAVSVPFAFHMLSKNKRTFTEKLALSSIAVKERYEKIVKFLKRIDGIRVINGKKYETYKCKSTPIVRFAIRGKTLNAYLGLNAGEYENSKYVFENVSNKGAFKNYQMRVKITSERQARWVIELLNDIVLKNNLTLLKEPIENVFENFNKLYKKKTFRARLRKISLESKERLKIVTAHLNSIEKVSEKQFNEHRIYKLKGKPILKVVIKGKTVCLCLAILPSALQGTKYVYKDASNVKKHKKYPTIVKLTSNRQVKWSIELINKIVEGILGGEKL